MQRPEVNSIFDNDTNNVSHIAIDRDTGICAIYDSLLDYDAASGRTNTNFADQLISIVEKENLTVDWIIETHVHADHLSAAHYLKSKLGGRIGIGENITEVQKIFGALFNESIAFRADGSQFDHLFTDGELYQVGNIQAKAIHTPGHTPACMTHLVGDAAFVGDTLFMPDFGSARCDFPGGDARMLYRSVQRIFELPDETRLFLNHDYKAKGRENFCWETSVGEEKRHNIHLREGITEDEFVEMRSERDKVLSMPKLIVPSVQVNMRAGDMPPPETNGIRYIKVPIDQL